MGSRRLTGKDPQRKREKTDVFNTAKPAASGGSVQRRHRRTWSAQRSGANKGHTKREDGKREDPG